MIPMCQAMLGEIQQEAAPQGECSNESPKINLRGDHTKSR